MVHRSSAVIISEAVCTIMLAKIVYQLHGHHNTKNSDHLEDQVSKSCVAIRTTTWKVQHGCLRLTLSDSALACSTNGVIKISDPPPTRPNKQKYQRRDIQLQKTCTKVRPRCSLYRVVDQNCLP